MHELIHATGIHNHGSEFKKIANIVNKKFGYNIKRTGKVEFNDNDFKYILQCKNCGNKIRRHKKSKVIQHPEYFTCGSCGGKLERIK
jgi:predicted SprT family Zn-dependent metalloprotease